MTIDWPGKHTERLQHLVKVVTSYNYVPFDLLSFETLLEIYTGMKDSKSFTNQELRDSLLVEVKRALMRKAVWLDEYSGDNKHARLLKEGGILGDDTQA